ncbi:hypothetical protein [Microcoleus vaginatus]|uniref:hypothetical protein n=1 Tax=Microcoleus vaginatus TaxID=119532 RepID=UPI001F61FB30
MRCILKKLITADRQVMKLSSVVPEVINERDNWRSTSGRIGDLSSKLDRPRNKC